MTDFKIDNKHIKKLHNAVDHLIDHIAVENKKLIDKDEDLFVRYMAYSRLASIITTFTCIMEMARTQVRIGFDISNDALDTKQREESGWTGVSLSGNPFFECEKSEESEESEKSDDDVRSKIKKILADALLHVMESKKNEH